MSFKTRIVLFVCLVSPLCAFALGALKFHRIAGDESAGSFANSIIIEGRKELLLVDAQRTSANAKLVINKIRGLHKKLGIIFITHAHPDHFLGLADIKKEFPDAKVLATEPVRKEIIATAETLRQFVAKSLQSQGLADHVPDTVVIPDTAVGPTLLFEGQSLNILQNGAGESATSAMLYIPSAKTLIAGDLIYNKVHLFLNDEDFDGWSHNLDQLRDRKDVTVIFPGHGEAGDAKLIDANADYIVKYKQASQTSKSADEAITFMKTLFPNYKMDRFLSYGLANHFRKRAAK